MWSIVPAPPKGIITVTTVYERGIAVLGLGYIGLPTAAILATHGVRVIGVDVNESVVDSVSQGKVPFVEPDLGAALSGAVANGNLTATTEVPQADGFIIAVPTPILADKSADLSYVRSAVEAIAPRLRGGEFVVLESTSPPGTSRQIASWLRDLRPDLVVPATGGETNGIHVAHCPERVLPGRIMIELVTNDRVVGGLTPKCAELAADLYRIFCQGEIALTDATTAEMVKLAENSFRDVNLAYANELSVLCDKLEIDVWGVIEAANRHPRVNILNPGPGVGGHCIAVDPWFIVDAAPDEARLIRTSREINDAKPEWVVGKVLDAVGGNTVSQVACLGLAFKADVDDLRESPAIEVVERISKALPDASILVVEPHVTTLPKSLEGLANVRLVDTAEIADADAVVLLVDHRQFGELDPRSFTGTVIDTRGQWRHLLNA
jgi:UDP-N-acetyl-D-mannosaminuronic acid dehydrogenase